MGIEVFRSKVKIVLSQRKYALELILYIGLIGGKVTITPLDKNLKLTSDEYDEVIQANQDDEVLHNTHRGEA